MRIGLLGAGRIGALHARTLRNTPGVDELIVADMDAGRAAAVAADVDAASATVDEAIARADALVIASPTPTHASLIRRAVEAGRPAFCEKPLAGDLAETIDLVAQIEASGLPFQLGFQRRFDAGYREARRLVGAGVIDGGMLPKVESALRALESGTAKAHILDGRIPHAILLEIFTKEGIGTEIVL